MRVPEGGSLSETSVRSSISLALLAVTACTISVTLSLSFSLSLSLSRRRVAMLRAVSRINKSAVVYAALQPTASFPPDGNGPGARD